jgi:hypothetical protein
MRCSPTVNVDQIKPFHKQADDPPAQGPVSDPGQEGEHEVLLNRKEIRGVLHYLVRWRGHTSADDEWLLAEELAHCQERWPSTTLPPRAAGAPAGTQAHQRSLREGQWRRPPRRLRPGFGWRRRRRCWRVLRRWWGGPS